MRLGLTSKQKIVALPTIGTEELGRQNINPGTPSDMPPLIQPMSSEFMGESKHSNAMADFAAHKARLQAAPSLEERAVIIDHMKQDAEVAQIESKIRQQKQKEMAEQQKQLLVQQKEKQKQLQEKQKAMQAKQKEVQARHQAAQKQQQLKMKFDAAMAPLTKQAWATEYCKTASIPQLSVRGIYV